MRDRLIELLNEADNKFGCFNAFCTERATEEAKNELLDYLLENGVVCLPCKVGDTVLEDASNRTLTKLFILNQPTLEIVTCEDCYYCKKPEDDWNFYCTRNEGIAHKVNYDDFCSRGLSRKDD